MPEKIRLKRKKLKKVKMLKKKGEAAPLATNTGIDTEVPPSSEDEGQEIKIEEEEEKEVKEEIEKEAEEEKLSVALNYKALNKVLRHGLRFSSPNKPREEWIECMGFLIGNVNQGKVKVNDAIPMVHGNLVEVEFQMEHYARADEINQTLTDDNWVVGWYHTHPGHGLFLSRVDKINHAGYQSVNSKAIALVFDPTLFSDSVGFEEYIKIFRLENPDLREGSEFNEVKKVELLHPVKDVINAVFHSAMLTGKDYPLILEYGEDYKKPEVIMVTPEESVDMEKDIEEMKELIKNMKKEIKLLYQQMQKQMSFTKEAVEKLQKREGELPKTKPKRVSVCEFCGYDSIMPGDKTCGNCGVKL